MLKQKSEQSEWADVKPIEQDDSENIVVIRYRDEYKEVFGYFRAIVASGEKSLRAFNLTTECLELNPFNPEVWLYRQQIIKKIKYNIKNELFYSEFLIRENPKNFLGWNHRRVIANFNLSLVEVYLDIELTESILQVDPKNYYCFQHRQWLLKAFKFKHFGLPREELQFTNRLIEEDVRNNSAWNQRFFVFKYLPGYADMTTIWREFEYALKKIKMSMENESSWNYLKGLLLNFGTKNLSQFDEASKYVNKLYNEEESRSRFVVSYLIDLTIEKTLESCSCQDILNAKKIKCLCLEMEKIDVIHSKYWQFVFKKFQFDKRKAQVVGKAAVNENWKNGAKKLTDFDVYLNYTPADVQQKVVFKKMKKYKVVEDKNVTKIGQDLLINLMNKYEQK